jgi:hypothetical protein
VFFASGLSPKLLAPPKSEPESGAGCDFELEPEARLVFNVEFAEDAEDAELLTVASVSGARSA